MSSIIVSLINPEGIFLFNAFIKPFLYNLINSDLCLLPNVKLEGVLLLLQLFPLVKLLYLESNLPKLKLKKNGVTLEEEKFCANLLF